MPNHSENDLLKELNFDFNFNKLCLNALGYYMFLFYRFVKYRFEQPKRNMASLEDKAIWEDGEVIACLFVLPVNVFIHFVK